MIKLRPHHLLCIQNYVGKGYDEDFTLHMNELTGLLRAEPGTKILLVEGGDHLCSACPHFDGSVCERYGKVKTLDEKVLSFCNAAYGDCGSWEALSSAAAGVFDSKVFEDICGDCEWFGLCRATLNK